MVGCGGRMGLRCGGSRGAGLGCLGSGGAGLGRGRVRGCGRNPLASKRATKGGPCS